jgi:hypothetical protein
MPPPAPQRLISFEGEKGERRRRGKFEKTRKRGKKKEKLKFKG